MAARSYVANDRNPYKSAALSCRICPSANKNHSAVLRNTGDLLERLLILSSMTNLHTIYIYYLYHKVYRYMPNSFCIGWCISDVDTQKLTLNSVSYFVGWVII